MSYKKIKNMTAAILLGCAVLSQSCTSWLDITPEAQVNDKKIFSTPQGFKDVLNGIYITASGEVDAITELSISVDNVFMWAMLLVIAVTLPSESLSRFTK